MQRRSPRSRPSPRGRGHGACVGAVGRSGCCGLLALDREFGQSGAQPREAVGCWPVVAVGFPVFCFISKGRDLSVFVAQGKSQQEVREKLPEDGRSRWAETAGVQKGSPARRAGVAALRAVGTVRRRAPAPAGAVALSGSGHHFVRSGG